MRIIKIVLPAALAVAGVGQAAGLEPAPDFTRGFSLETALQEVPEVPKARLTFINKLRATRDCKFIIFKAGDSAVSRPATLTSYVFETVCEEYQDGRHCFENLLRKERRKVLVELTGNRTPLPWEREVFGVCLEDTRVTVEVAEASHRYKILKKPGVPEFLVEARAEKKIQAAPDPAAITAGSLEISEGPCGLRLGLKDKWGAFYAAYPGESTVLRVTLKQDKPAWFDGVVLKKELQFSPDGNYTVDFSQFAPDFRRALEPGTRYYAEWGFYRKGDISRSTFVNGGETPRTVFSPR